MYMSFKNNLVEVKLIKRGMALIQYSNGVMDIVPDYLLERCN